MFINHPGEVGWELNEGVSILDSRMGATNSGGRGDLPSPETLAAVEGCTLLRADRNGWIQVSTDGEQLWVEVERQ